MAPTSTGHPLGDAILPSVQRLVGAVRTGNPTHILDAINNVREAAGDHPYWRTALIVVLAGMVPDDVPPSRLLQWNIEREDT